MFTKPMSAGGLNSLEELNFSNGKYYLATPKLDGIRCLRVGDRAVSKTFKPIANVYTRQRMESMLPEGADGELVVGKTFQETSSAIMSRDGEPQFTFYWFDYIREELSTPYERRMLQMRDHPCEFTNVVKLFPQKIFNLEELLSFEQKCIDDGYEGIILRSPQGRYKEGKATVKEDLLLKFKRFTDGEAEIIGFEELLRNTNEAKKDNFGRTKRSSAKAGKVPAGVLGKFKVRDIVTGIEFQCGSGLTAKQRKEIWENTSSYLGRLIKYKHFAVTGVKVKPRHPIFLGFRSRDDML